VTPSRRARALAALATLLATAQVTAPAARAAGPADRLSETRRKLQATRAQLAAFRRSDAELLAVIRSLSGQLGVVSGRLADAERTLARIEASIRAEERTLARLEEERRARAGLVGARAAAMYVMGPGAQAEAILGSRSMQELIDRSASLEYAMRFDRILMDDLARLADRSRKTRAALARQRAAADAWRDEIAARAAELSDVLETKQLAEQALAERIAAFQAEVRELEREQARILALIRSRQSRSTGPVSRRGFIWPIRGRITSDYGPRWGGFHTGIDIDCETGDTIVAAKDGTVIASEWGGGYGQMIIIDHGNGVSTLYAHNSRLYVSDGQRVARGQRISACGATGNATGDHLHFEVRIDGEPTDPKPFLP
jgi:murein DD-endopeptidase MepM/ murein hydrolase activator NlpD